MDTDWDWFVICVLGTCYGVVSEEEHLIKRRIHLIFILVGALLILAGMQRLWADHLQSKEKTFVAEENYVSPKVEESGADENFLSNKRSPQSTIKEDEEGGKKRISPQNRVVFVSIHGRNGPILTSFSIPYREGETALSLLIQVAKLKHIPIEYRGFGATSYVIGISNLYEFDHGSQSGWVYRVNGRSLSMSSGAYCVHSGDRIKWLYTDHIGNGTGALVR